MTRIGEPHDRIDHEPTQARSPLGPLLRTVLPSLATLVLVVALLITMFFTSFGWQWVTFLGGVLFASGPRAVVRASSS